MLRTHVVILLMWGLAACSPTFNWREVRPENTRLSWREVRMESAGLRAMLPCKPDKAARTVEMGGRQVSLEVLGCDTGGATFAVLSADIAEPTRTGEVLTQWKTATQANMRASVTQEVPFVPPGALSLPQSQQVIATGQRPDGSKVDGRAAYFARGSRVYQAVIYADSVRADMVDTFFSGLRLE